MYQVVWQGRVIGESKLEYADEFMGVLSGSFVPALAYREVEPVFRQYREAGTNMADMDKEKMQAFFAARAALGLSLRAEDGQPLPVNTIHIDDYGKELGEYEVTVWTDGLALRDSCDSTPHWEAA